MNSFELPPAKTIIEPFRIKSVEPLPMLSTAERRAALDKAFYNLFNIAAKDVTFDFLTDSGTSAMSASQWASIMSGDESYAGANSYFKFTDTVGELTGLEEIIPTHQGRSAEALLAKALLKPTDTVISNTHFDTTRANFESVGAKTLDLPCEETKDSQKDFDFKGNINIAELKQFLSSQHMNVPFVVMTVTNNSVGGQPVSMANLQQTKEVLKPYQIPLFIDAARFAENAYFIKIREEGYADKSVKTIAQEMFALANGVLMSAKKDAFANIGGFLALRDKNLAEEVRGLMVITEGFPTYGGMAGRDMEAVAVGLQEILAEEYLHYRIHSVKYFGEGVAQTGLKVVRPTGGHAVYIDAGGSLPHLEPLEYPAQSLSVALYEHIGLRGVEVGSVMLGRVDQETGMETPAPHELVRMAMPRRVYTQSHIDYIVEKMAGLVKYKNDLPAYKIDFQNQFLRHFTARFSQTVH